MSDTTPAKPDYVKAALAIMAASALALLLAGFNAALTASEKVDARLKQERTDNHEWTNDRFVSKDTFAQFREEQVKSWAAVRDLIRDGQKRR